MHWRGFYLQNIVIGLQLECQIHENLSSTFFHFFLSSKPPNISERSTWGTAAGVTASRRLILPPPIRNQSGIQHNWKPNIPSTHDGAALVVPATCPGKQEHLTVWDLSSILFLLQQRCAAMTSQVPAFTCTESTNKVKGYGGADPLKDYTALRCWAWTRINKVQHKKT